MTPYSPALLYPPHYGMKQRGTKGALPRSCLQHLKHTLVGTLKLECTEVGDREAWQKTTIGHVKPQVTVAHLWVSICFVFQTHGGLAREYTHKKGIVHMSHSGFCVGKGTPRYVDWQKVTINVSQIKETARPGAIKRGSWWKRTWSVHKIHLCCTGSPFLYSGLP